MSLMAVETQSRRGAVQESVMGRIGEILDEAHGTGEVLDYLTASPGKLLRPLLVFLASEVCGAPPKKRLEITDAAVGVELVHMASLVHDDIVDDGEMRRGRLSTHRRYGSKVAALVGDYLFAAAFGLFSSIRSSVMHLMTTVIREMCVGEINQLFAPIRTEDEYWIYIRRKTAYLIGACCRLGPILAGQDDRYGRVMQEFGESIGLAFQLTDDVLDYRGSMGKMGKKAGTDFAESVWTLPIIRAYQRGLISNQWSAHGFTYVQTILEEEGILTEIWTEAINYVHHAVQLITHFPDSQAKDELVMLAQALLTREA